MSAPWQVYAVAAAGLLILLAYLEWVRGRRHLRRVLWYAPMAAFLLLGAVLVCAAIIKFHPGAKGLATALLGAVIVAVRAIPLLWSERRNPLNEDLNDPV